VSIQFTENQILVDGRPDLLFGGEFQYFRLKRELWEGTLQSLKDAGVNVISCYIPWIWHEAVEGSFDFDGTTRPERDLRGFLYLVRRLGIPLIVKPGPYIYAEYPGFGIPQWIREKHPEILIEAVSGEKGEIALGHPTFHALTRKWFAEIAPLLQPMVESGEIVALQLDNECGMPQYGAGPTLIDRNPQSLSQLRDWLAERHADIAALNSAWGTTFASFQELQPPSAPLARPVLDDLARFTEDQVVDYLATLKRFWQELGIRTHFFLNDVWLPAWPNHVLKKNEVAPVGFDMYPKFIRVRTPLDQPYAIDYVPKLYASMLKGGPLIGPELGAGWLDEGVTVPVISTLQKMMATYLRGSKANLMYPLHDGEDPDSSIYRFRSPFSHEGKRSERMEVVEALGHFRQDWGPLLASSEEVESPVGILHYQDATHDLLAYISDPLRTARENLDEAIDHAVALFPAASGLYGALVEAGYSPRVMELSKVRPDQLKSCKVLFFSSLGTVPSLLREKLERFVQEGGTLVTMGTPFDSPLLFPGKPKRTWHPRALSVVTGGIKDLFMFTVRDRDRVGHPMSRYTLSKLQPVMGMVKHATRAGVWLNDSLHGGKVWCSRMITYVQMPPDAQELLTYHQAPVGYSVAVGQGRSAFIGTLLGPIVDSPGYYLDDPARKQSISSFVSSLLHGLDVPPIARPIPGMEAVYRETSAGWILGLINRGDSLKLSYRLPEGWPIDRISQQFSYMGSRLKLQDGVLSGMLVGGDVAILHLARPQGD